MNIVAFVSRLICAKILMVTLKVVLSIRVHYAHIILKLFLC